MLWDTGVAWACMKPQSLPSQWHTSFNKAPPPNLSQTVHHLFVTKHSNVYVSPLRDFLIQTTTRCTPLHRADPKSVLQSCWEWIGQGHYREGRKDFPVTIVRTFSHLSFCGFCVFFNLMPLNYLPIIAHPWQTLSKHYDRHLGHTSEQRGQISV